MLFGLTNNQRIFLSFILFGLALGTCERPQRDQPKETILVNIADRLTISTDEFIRRAEYTIRPPYCNGDSYLHKKIVLNSLIAEKLMALEAGPDHPLLKNEAFQLFLKGRKEQAMRQWMYHQEATRKVSVDSTEIKKYFRFAGREYEVAYYSLSDSSALSRFRTILATGKNAYEQFYQQIYSDTSIPKRKVIWHHAEDPAILRALFARERHKGEVLPPIEIDKNEYVILKILGWTDTKVITNAQIQQRFQSIHDYLANEMASNIWQRRVAEIMAGKTVHFNEPIFWKLNQLFFEHFFKPSEDLKNMIQQQIWDVEPDLAPALDHLTEQDLLRQPFLTVDGTMWTVGDFRKELMSHPLVFRERHFPAAAFARQFRLAVIDLIRDRYVTQEAYRQGYDRVNIVQRNEQMWRDAYLALEQKNALLQAINQDRNFEKHYLQMISDHLNHYVDSLQQKYHKKVRLDFDEFERIHLSSIDLYVTQKSQPYRMVVPRFPTLTTIHSIEYIERLKK
ncbi:MAG: peptidylprolyl isomerase [candidate division KSB1 bacterium]|nr:peptidylprolyl isomerase [candidate division KSB1 bacterium]